MIPAVISHHIFLFPLTLGETPAVESHVGRYAGRLRGKRGVGETASLLDAQIMGIFVRDGETRLCHTCLQGRFGDEGDEGGKKGLFGTVE